MPDDELPLETDAEFAERTRGWPKGLLPYADRVKAYDNHKAYGEGHWAYLGDEWYSDDMDCRTLHEDTVGELVRKVRAARKATAEEIAAIK